MSLSAIIITKNAENVIEDCLRSVAFCGEIIVVDGGSTDATISIAKKAGAKVLVGDAADFAKQRNIGLHGAKGEWILYIDSDERVSTPLRENIMHHISNIKYQDVVAYRLKRKNFYLGNHEWPHIERLERLFKKSALQYWQGKLHESPVVEGNIGELDGFLLHYTHRDLSSMTEKTIEWSQIEARLRFDANHPPIVWWRFPRVMLTAFYDSYIRQGGWRVGTPGLIESIFQTFSMFITYARLWEMQQSSHKTSV